MRGQLSPGREERLEGVQSDKSSGDAEELSRTHPRRDGRTEGPAIFLARQERSKEPREVSERVNR